jgi:hypothetical protein
MKGNENKLPQFAEEKILYQGKTEKNTQTDLKSEDILKTRTPIPSDFIKLEVQEGNYCGSTNPK